MSYPPPPQGSPEWQGQPPPQHPQEQPAPPYGGYPTQSYGSGYSGEYGAGYGAGYGGAPTGYGYPVRTSGKATASLVLGIASLVLCFLGFLLGVPAIIVGMRARKEIRNSQGQVGGDGAALGGIITGVLGTLLGLVVVGLFVALFALGNSVTTVVDRACEQAAQDNNPNNDCA